MINVVIADHQAIFRAGVAKILAVEEDLRIVGQPSTPEQMLNALEKLRPRVAVLSTGFLSYLPEIQQIAQRRQIAVLVICDNTENASDFMRMGVQGVIYRSASGNMVVEAVRRLAQGQSFLQGPNSSEVEVNEDLVGARVRDRLSERELRIIAAIVQGYKNREIAAQLYTSEQVVKNALRNIFDKIGVSDRLELALFVVHHRILAQATASVALHPPGSRAQTVSLRQRVGPTSPSSFIH
ncbi:MAG TPA: response regulator transcription factor [Terriglobales bacterium]|nr:response regulator transcription factor [Terriglobales bacterium]